MDSIILDQLNDLLENDVDSEVNPIWTGGRAKMAP